MASNDEGQGSGDCNVYAVADAYLNLLDEQRLLQGPPITGAETGAETDTGAETGEAGIEPKPKRQRRPNQLITTRLVVTEVDDGNFEPKEPAEARACFGNQIGCILRATATINDAKLWKIPDMKQSLLTNLHQVFLFPGRDEIKYKNPDKDPVMKKINRRAMGKFSGVLSA